MQPINILTSTAAPLPLPNIDTDQIIPKQFLKRIERTGYGDFLFFDWRRIQEGPDTGKPDPDFVLNKPHHQGAEILIAERNFGCGSSREHAAWAIHQFGFRAVIAPTFADIFYSNAGQKRHHPRPPHRRRDPNPARTLDRQPQTPDHHQPRPTRPSPTTQGFHAHFDIDPFRKYCLLNGLDDIGLTLRHEIRARPLRAPPRHRILAHPQSLQRSSSSMSCCILPTAAQANPVSSSRQGADR